MNSLKSFHAITINTEKRRILPSLFLFHITFDNSLFGAIMNLENTLTHTTNEEVNSMVRLFIKEEYMSMQNRMIVKDVSGHDTYLIVGKWGRAGDALSIYSLDGTRLAEAKQKKLSLFPTFELKVNGERIGRIKKRPGIHGIKKPYFTVSRLNWLITGDFEAQKYTVRQQTNVIMRLEKNYSFIGDFYALRINKDEMAPICCLISVIVDHYSPSKRPSLWQQFTQRQARLGFLHPMLIEYQETVSKMKKNPMQAKNTDS